MFGTTYYHATIKKYVALFGTLFNDVWINRYDDNQNVKQSFKVPLAYGPREKFLARIQGIDVGKDPQDNEFAIILPRMGFEITSFNYAAERKLSTINRFTSQDIATNPDKRMYQYNPVPYDINFQLSVFVKNTEDGTMIVEQILPYFTPEWTTTVQLVSEPNITLDIPLVLNTVSFDDVYEGSFEERRSLIWTLDFTMKAYIFGPTKKQEVIKLANVQLYSVSGFDNLANETVDERVSVYPGQTANGEATTDANNTVASSEISSDENWGYIVNIDTQPASFALFTLSGGERLITSEDQIFYTRDS